MWLLPSTTSKWHVSTVALHGLLRKVVDLSECTFCADEVSCNRWNRKHAGMPVNGASQSALAVYTLELPSQANNVLHAFSFKREVEKHTRHGTVEDSLHWPSIP
jgi:hypothetical protein